MLKKAYRTVNEIGIKPMLEPADYSDYVMLDVLGGCGELVVNSRNLGRVCTDPNAVYTPGVRLYFNIRAMIKDRLISRDGLHLAKVRDRLPLGPYLEAVVSADDFPSDIQWTPNSFTEKANEFFLASCRNRKKADSRSRPL